MDFKKKILDRLHDKVAPPSSVKPSSMTIQQQQRRSMDKKKFTKLSKWRGKWGNVTKSRLFSNNKKDPHTIDISCPSSIREPTITLSSPTILQRPHSAIDHVSHLDYLQQKRPTSCTPAPPPAPRTRTRQSRLSVPYVVNHLRSSTPLDVYSSDDTGSFYNAPLSPPPPPAAAARRSTWYHLSYHHHHNDDDDEHLDGPPADSASSTSWVSKGDDDDPNSNDCQSPVFVGNQATTVMINETLIQQLHKGDSSSQDDDDSPPAAMPCQEKRPHYQLVTMNVATTMMTMREKQLELQMEQLRMKNQQLEQQMEDVVSGTWTSTTQLIEENDRLESQIRQLQLQQQQRRIKPSPINGNGNGGGESYLLDEQEALRHTRAQLGLVEYLEGEPDVMAALNRFKKLLASSC